jgi:hypothetical protein
MEKKGHETTRATRHYRGRISWSREMAGEGDSFRIRYVLRRRLIDGKLAENRTFIQGRELRYMHEPRTYIAEKLRKARAELRQFTKGRV